MNWPAVPKATGYVLKAKAGILITKIIVNDSSGTLTGLQPYTSYIISVQSLNQGGTSQPSMPVETRTGTFIPSSNECNEANIDNMLQASVDSYMQAISFYFRRE